MLHASVVALDHWLSAGRSPVAGIETVGSSAGLPHPNALGYSSLGSWPGVVKLNGLASQQTRRLSGMRMRLDRRACAHQEVANVVGAHRVASLRVARASILLTKPRPCMAHSNDTHAVPAPLSCPQKC